MEYYAGVINNEIKLINQQQPAVSSKKNYREKFVYNL